MTSHLPLRWGGSNSQPSYLRGYATRYTGIPYRYFGVVNSNVIPKVQILKLFNFALKTPTKNDESPYDQNNDVIYPNFHSKN